MANTIFDSADLERVKQAVQEAESRTSAEIVPVVARSSGRFDKRIHHTDRGSGVLVYVSLFERMAAIIADQSVLNKVGQSRLDEWCVEFTQRLGKGTPIDAICETIGVIGQQLAPLLPRTESQSNELADLLVELNGV